MIWTLRSGLSRNFAGITHKGLFTRTTCGTKKVIEDYVQEVSDQLERLCREDIHGLTLSEKYFLFQDTRHAYGRTALLLSGGAAFGMYHIGVIKALHENSLLPRVISGSSVGSLVAGMLATKTDEELPECFSPDFVNLDVFEQLGDTGAFQRRVQRFLNEGVIMDVGKLQLWAQKNIGNYTFKEAYEKTGRIVNITVSSTRDLQFPTLLNYLTAPYVLIWSAASASCAIPGVYAAVELMAKDKSGSIVPYHPNKIKWSDGSVENDLPMRRLSELFNVSNFIVSQVNPHVVAFMESEIERVGLVSKAFGVVKRFVLEETAFRFKQIAELGLLPRWMRFLQPLVAQKYTGDITITPPISLDEYSKLLKNPNREEFKRCIEVGERCTWPLIDMIKIYLKVENTLDKAVNTLKPHVKAYNFKRKRSGNGPDALTDKDE